MLGQIQWFNHVSGWFETTPLLLLGTTAGTRGREEAGLVMKPGDGPPGLLEQLRQQSFPFVLR